MLTFPEQFSLPCRVQLTLSGLNSRAGVQGCLLFSWNISTELGTMNSSFEAFSLDSDTQLPVDELLLGFLYVRLTVRDLYGQEAWTEGTVLLNQSGGSRGRKRSEFPHQLQQCVSLSREARLRTAPLPLLMENKANC